MFGLLAMVNVLVKVFDDFLMRFVEGEFQGCTSDGVLGTASHVHGGLVAILATPTGGKAVSIVLRN